MGRDIGESATLEVGVLGVILLCFVGDVGEIFLDSGVLVPSSRKVVGETAGGGVPGYFWGNV
jgi:hypothetical protein